MTGDPLDPAASADRADGHAWLPDVPSVWMEFPNSIPKPFLRMDSTDWILRQALKQFNG